MKDLILKLLTLVPDSRVQTAATTLSAIVTLIRHQPSVATERSVEAAIAEALEPWRRIKARAEAETHTGVQDADGFVVGRED